MRLRGIAAKLTLKERNNLDDTRDELADIDPILDFFEDLGSYERGVWISFEALHHHFFEWLRDYYSAVQEYIEARRDKEPGRWEHIRELLETISEYQAELSVSYPI